MADEQPKRPPNPGSDEAVKAGCVCPRMDNNFGAGRGGDGDRFGWVRRMDCPMHGERAGAGGEGRWQ